MDLKCGQDMSVRYSGNVGLAMSHQCCLLRLTDHFKPPDLSPCDNSHLGFLKETVAQQHTNCLRPSASHETPFKCVNPQVLQCSTEHGAEWFCVMRMMEHS
jgi:hypothetical protein